MLSEAKNKMQEADETKVAPTKAVAVSKLQTEFFYPPNDGYAAIAVIAASRDEADQVYLAARVKLSEEKVEETKTETTQ